MKKNLAQSKPLTWAIIALLTWGLTLSIEAGAAEDLRQAKRAIRLQDYSLAFELYKSAANNGDSEAQYQVANLYQQGLGIEQNDLLAVKMLELSSAQGNAAAQYHLGLRKTETDYLGAMALINLAAEQGYAAASNHLKKLESESELLTTDQNKLQALWFGSARKDRIEEMQRLFEALDQIDLVDENGQTALHIATEFQNTPTAEWLLERGANPDKKDQFDRSAIFMAVANNDRELLQLLLDNGADRNQTLPNGDTLLHFNVRLGHVQLLTVLAGQGVPVNSLNNDGASALDLATNSGNDELEGSLLKLNATHSQDWLATFQPDTFERQVDQFNDSAVSSSVDVVKAAQIIVSGNQELLQTVLQKNPALVNQHLEDGTTLLALSVKNSLPDTVTTLLEFGADPNLPIYENIVPLQIATRLGEQRIIEILLRSGANPLHRDLDNWDSIDWAIYENRSDMGILLVNWLINDPQYQDIPLNHYMLIAAQHDLKKLTGFLLEHTAGEDFDGSRRNAIWYATENSNALLVDQLLRAGFSANVPDIEGRTPFHVATRSGCLACARLLLSHSDINQQSHSGASGLMTAVANGNENLISWLLENKADIELRNAQGNTALMIAVEADDVRIARLLLDAGANVSRKNNLGISALDIAAEKNPSLHELLKKETVFGFF